MTDFQHPSSILLGLLSIFLFPIWLGFFFLPPALPLPSFAYTFHPLFSLLSSPPGDSILLFIHLYFCF